MENKSMENLTKQWKTMETFLELSLALSLLVDNQTE